ncbi:AraC family transcriptional regulator [Lacticaseibacillus parakribbianus]|uniref:AraC family transcriptional regulator n=1 Tax=Lacticaseibacillus parakribbianus TaxID=2970927 RepID=UPI0021CB3FB6|nr:helix-turn-helix domain-containing protein [Lacticaseibacillus parakribbianus]
MDRDVLHQLQALSPIEQQQRQSRQVADDIPPAALDLGLSETTNMPVLNDYFFRNRSIYVSKHNRFAAYPLHTHQFLELNYMLTGTAVEHVNGQRVVLQQGDLLLLDSGSRHAIEALGEGDLLINVLFRDQNISLDLLTRLQSQRSVLYDFLAKRVQPKQPRGFVRFAGTAQGEVQATLQRLITEYYQGRELADTILQAELTVLLAQLSRNYPQPAAKLTSGQALALRMLKAIHEDYAQVSLGGLATALNYNRNYLGNLFRREVGQTFSAALTQERLLRARDAIQTTEKPLRLIAQEVGLRNTSFFYTHYAAQFGHAPKVDRATGPSDLRL